MNGGSGLESLSTTNYPAFAPAFLQTLPPGCAPPSSQLFRGNGKALTAFPGHRPLGGAVAPPTRAGGARETEAQPLSKAQARGSTAARPAGLPSWPLSPSSCSPHVWAVSRLHPHPDPRLPAPLRLWRPWLSFRPVRPKAG